MPWIEWEGEEPPVLAEGDDAIVMVHLGHPDRVEDMRLSLAAELRTEGIIQAFGTALEAAQGAVLTYGWFGYVEDDPVPIACNGRGVSVRGHVVDRAIPAVFTVVHQSA